MKSRIKPMIWNIRKKKTFNQYSKKKKEFKKSRTVSGDSGKTSKFQHSHHRGAKRRRERARNLKK